MFRGQKKISENCETKFLELDQEIDQFDTDYRFLCRSCIECFSAIIFSEKPGKKPIFPGRSKQSETNFPVNKTIYNTSYATMKHTREREHHIAAPGPSPDMTLSID